MSLHAQSRDTVTVDGRKGLRHSQTNVLSRTVVLDRHCATAVARSLQQVRTTQGKERGNIMPEKVRGEAPARVSSFLIEDLLRSSKREERQAAEHESGREFYRDQARAGLCSRVQVQEQVRNPTELCGFPSHGDFTLFTHGRLCGNV